ncbi:hypothetical protein ACWF94_16040 [Streptomyces sp. NPDC055078]
MPRGRHRHSPPLHRLLPPSAVAGASVLCAAGAWMLTEPVMLRTLVTAAAAAAVTGAALMRSWDRSAGQQVADLTRGRANDAWQHEERIAELESDIEESRELRAKLDAKLRTKRVELASLRGEHAALLRRYATAETERASALEGRRQLAIEASEPRPLTAAGVTPTVALFRRAVRALDDLPRSAAAQEAAREAARTAGDDREDEGTDGLTDGPTGSRTADRADERTGGQMADPADRVGDREGGPGEVNPEVVTPEADEPRGKAVAGAGREQHTRPTAALPARRPGPGAAAVVPYGPRRGAALRRPEGTFDYFGKQHASAAEAAAANAANAAHAAHVANRAHGANGLPVVSGLSGRGTQKAIEAVQSEDLADVVGEEVLADEMLAEEVPAERRPDAPRAVGDVIDLTHHDSPEHIELRDAVSS